MNDKYFFKVILLGDSATGAKTSLMLRIVNNTFSEWMISTIGFSYTIYRVETKYGIVKLQIYDTAGQEKYRNFAINNYRGTHCFILGYDITNEYSFKNIKNYFYDSIIEDLDVNPIKNPLIYLVANKIDLSDRIQVSDEEAMSFANEK